MDFLLLYRNLHEEKIVSAEKIDLLVHSYKTWLATNHRPLVYPYGIVYYADGMLCSMPFQIRTLRPLGIEKDGVFYLNKCLTVENNPNYPDWDDQFVFSDYPKALENDVFNTLKLLKKQIFTELTDWEKKEPEFEFELPTLQEIFALSDTLCSISLMKKLFINGGNYWLKKQDKIAPYRVFEPYKPATNPFSTGKEIEPDTASFKAMVMPIVHQGEKTFIGKLNEFSAADEATFEMYQKLTAHT